MSVVDDRRKKLITLLARDAYEEDHDGSIAKGFANELRSTPATIVKDLQELKDGYSITEEQGALADEIENAKTEQDVDRCMAKLCRLVLRGLVGNEEAKTAQSILMGRRYFLSDPKDDKGNRGAPLEAVVGTRAEATGRVA